MSTDEWNEQGHGSPAAPPRRMTWNSLAIDDLRSLQDPGEPDLVGELVTSFRDDIRGVFERLCADVEKRDLKQVHEGAHRIKGGALNLGADRLSSAALELERASGNGDASQIDALLARLLAERDHFFERTATGIPSKGQ